MLCFTEVVLWKLGFSIEDLLDRSTEGLIAEGGDMYFFDGDAIFGEVFAVMEWRILGV